MFNNTITWIVCILMIIISIDCFNRFFRMKEGLATPTAEQLQKEKDARTKLTPANINSNNLKYITRSSKEIKDSLSRVKENINSTAVKIKEQCCKINKNYHKKNCNTTTRKMVLPACQNENPCKPCAPGSNNKDPHSCCSELITTHCDNHK